MKIRLCSQRTFAVLAFMFCQVFAHANEVPVYTAPTSIPKVRLGGSGELNLKTLFSDPDATGSAVRMNFRIGSETKPVDIVLYDQATPITVANFLAYVNSGRYAANFIHRSVPGFVIQGGGFRWVDTSVNSVSTYPAITNEPGISNLRGTIAMAKIGGDPNSATSQWFVNLGNNAANLDAQNGGFTVFGRVVGNGMTVVDEVAALPRYNAGGALNTLPLKDFSGSNILRVHTVETAASVISTLSFTALSNDPSLLDVAVNGSTLQLVPAGNLSGVATVELTATDLDGSTINGMLTVQIVSKSQDWHLGVNNQTFVLDPSDSGSLAEPVTLDWGNVVVTGGTARTFTLRNDGSVGISNYNVSISGTNAANFQVTEGAGPINLAAGQSGTFTVSFTPGAGPHTAILHVGSNDPDDASFSVTFSGSGEPDVTAPVFSAFDPPTLIAGATRTAVVPDWRGSLVTITDDGTLGTVTQTPAPGTVLPIGEHSLTFTAADVSGNSNEVSSSFTIEYSAATLPEVTSSSVVGGAAVPTEGSEDLPDNSVISAFGTPAISDDGSMVARVTLASGRARLAAVYAEDADGDSRIVAHQNQFTGVVTFRSFSDPLLSPEGRITFQAKSFDIASSDEGLWSDTFGTMSLILREGVEVPGLSGLKLKSITSVAVEDDALLVLLKLQSAAGQVTSASNVALVRITGVNSGVLLARTGTLFEGSLIKQISVLQPAAFSAGQGRWNHAEATIAKFTLADQRKVIVRLEHDGSQVRILQTGPLDPGFGNQLSKLGLPALGGSGVAVLATKAVQPGVTSGNDSALLFAADGTTFAEIAGEGPGSFASFSDPLVNADGGVAFVGVKRSAIPRLPNTSGIWQSMESAAPEIVAAQGATAVDAAGEPLENVAWSTFSSVALPDNLGPVFIAKLKGSEVTAQSNMGVWAMDSHGVLRMILRTGTDVELPSDTKRLKSFSLLNSLPGSFGARRSYNSNGAIAAQLTFTDGSQSIVRLNVP